MTETIVLMYGIRCSAFGVVHHQSALVLFIWVRNFGDSEILNKKLRDSKQYTKYIITLSCKKF